MKKVFALVVFAVVALPVEALPHGGGLDKNGCHNDRKHGGYHCHRGELAGQSFGSRAEAEEKLKGTSKPEGEGTPAEGAKKPE